jgi:hypothetical protein
MTISRGRIIYFTTSSPPLVIVLPFAASFLAFFFPVHTFFFSFQFFHPVPLLRPFQINHFVTFFHSIPFLHPVHLPVCFVAVGLLRWLPHFWRATIWTIICSLSGPLRPLAATHGHLQPAAATSDRNRSANASVPNLAPSRPGPPKKIRAFCDMTGLIIVFPVLTLYRV